MLFFFYESLDPCQTLEPGQYELIGELSNYFPRADSVCSFVKCANKRSFLKKCGHGSRYVGM